MGIGMERHRLPLRQPAQDPAGGEAEISDTADIDDAMVDADRIDQPLQPRDHRAPLSPGHSANRGAAPVAEMRGAGSCGAPSPGLSPGGRGVAEAGGGRSPPDRKSTRLNSSH